MQYLCIWLKFRSSKKTCFILNDRKKLNQFIKKVLIKIIQSSKWKFTFFISLNIPHVTVFSHLYLSHHSFFLCIKNKLIFVSYKTLVTKHTTNPVRNRTNLCETKLTEWNNIVIKSHNNCVKFWKFKQLK